MRNPHKRAKSEGLLIFKSPLALAVFSLPEKRTYEVLRDGKGRRYGHTFSTGSERFVNAIWSRGCRVDEGIVTPDRRHIRHILPPLPPNPVPELPQHRAETPEPKEKGSDYKSDSAYGGSPDRVIVYSAETPHLTTDIVEEAAPAYAPNTRECGTSPEPFTLEEFMATVEIVAESERSAAPSPTSDTSACTSIMTQTSEDDLLYGKEDSTTKCVGTSEGVHAGTPIRPATQIGPVGPQYHDMGVMELEDRKYMNFFTRIFSAPNDTIRKREFGYGFAEEEPYPVDWQPDKELLAHVRTAAIMKGRSADDISQLEAKANSWIQRNRSGAEGCPKWSEVEKSWQVRAVFYYAIINNKTTEQFIKRVGTGKNLENMHRLHDFAVEGVVSDGFLYWMKRSFFRHGLFGVRTLPRA
jgi:hypothetical protein